MNKESPAVPHQRASILVLLPFWIALVDFALVMFSLFSVKSFPIQALGLMVWVGVLLCLLQIITSMLAAFILRRLQVFADGLALGFGGIILFGLAMPA